MDNNFHYSSWFQATSQQQQQQQQDQEQHNNEIIPSNDFVFHQDPTTLFHQDLHFDAAYLDPENLFITPPLDDDNNDNNNNDNKPKSSGRGRGESSTSDGNKQQKRVMHRDVERQRRQEMASLYASLRFELPLEYIKGKRSTSDHVMQAVNYIEHKQKSIKELEERRDKLKGVNSSHCDVATEDCTNSNAIVSVEACLDGIEILIDSSKQGFRISKALDFLVQQRLHVLSCVCSRVDDRFLHTIRVQVSPHEGIDIQELQHNLSRVVS